MPCPRCQTDNREGRRFCSKCGAAKRRSDMGRRIARIALASLVLSRSRPPRPAPRARPTASSPSPSTPRSRPRSSTPPRPRGSARPFVFLYALHDALIKPLPGNDMAPCLAESWRESPDGLAYDFKLREGLKFHNGDPFTAEDVKFSFQRYRGTSAKLLARAREVGGRRRSRTACASCCTSPGRTSSSSTPRPPPGRRGSSRRSTSRRSARRASSGSPWASAPIGSCAWTRARSSCSRPTTSTGGRSRRSSASSSRAFPTARRGWPC